MNCKYIELLFIIKQKWGFLLSDWGIGEIEGMGEIREIGE